MKQSQAYQEALAQFLSSQDLCGKFVVCYRPLRGEVDITDLALGSSKSSNPSCSGRDISTQSGSNVFDYALTRIADKRQLTIHRFDSELETSQYGFRQPVAEAPKVDDKDVGAVLVPGLAFNRSGTRLGHGQGYYDRFLARLPKNILKVGVVTTLIDAIPQEPHDVTMTHLAFENKVIASSLSC